MTLHVLTFAEALPQHLEFVRGKLSDMASLTRMAEGCLRCDVYADRDTPLRFNTIEVWTSDEAHAAWLDSAILLRCVASLFGKMKGMPDVRLLNTISELED